MKTAILILIAAAAILRLLMLLTYKMTKERKPHRRMCAQVMCGGTNALARRKYNYDGVTDCKTASLLYGGPKLCTYGCVGMGTCVSVCPENAINIIGGIAAVDRSKCTACGKCIHACPKGIIKLVPKRNSCWVGCSNRSEGDKASAFCKMSCTACGECIEVCPVNAVSIVNGHAVIKNDICDGCGKCAEICPQKTIWQAKKAQKTIM